MCACTVHKKYLFWYICVVRVIEHEQKRKFVINGNVVFHWQLIMSIWIINLNDINRGINILTDVYSVIRYNTL